MIKQVVINKTTKKVLRWGYCDFTNDGMLDPDTEEVIEKDFIFDPPLSDMYTGVTTEWYWDGETFTETPPEVEGGAFLSYLTGLFKS